MSSAPSRRHGQLARDLAAVFSLALGVRLAHAAFLSRTEFFRGPLIDAAVYHETALALAGGGSIEEPFYQPPLVTLVLSCLYRVGLGTWGVAIVQSVAGALTCALLAIVGRHAMGAERRELELATGIAAALMGPLVLYDLELLPPVWVDLFLAAALALSLTGPPRPSLRDLGAGLCLGVAGTGWVPSLVVGLALGSARRVEKGRAVVVLLVVAGALVPLAATAHHNATHGAPGVLVSWNGGLNLWLGNNPDWRETWAARPGAEFEPLFERAHREGAIGPAEQDRWFRRAVLEDVRSNPAGALARTVEKLYYAWHGREIRRNQDYELLREASPVLSALQWELGLHFPFGLVAPLALVSMWRRRRERMPRALALTAFVYSGVLAVFFVATRYRLPLLMLVLPFAMDTAVVWIAGRPPRGELAAFAALVLALNLPAPFTASLRADADERRMLRAMAWRGQGRDDRAEPIAAELLARRPDDPNAHMLMAQILVARGDCESAIPHLEQTARGAPLATTPLLDLARCHLALGRLDAADRAYARALARDRYHADALRGAAILYIRRGQPTHAAALLEQLRATGQNDAGTDFDLARLWVEAGRTREALPILRELARARPEDEEVRRLLERAM